MSLLLKVGQKKLWIGDEGARAPTLFMHLAKLAMVG